MINLFYIVHDFSGARTYANELTAYLASQENIAIYLVFLQRLDYKEFTILKQNDITSIFIPQKITKIFYKKYNKRAAQLIFCNYVNLNNVIVHMNMPEQFYLAEEMKKLFQCSLVFTYHFLENFYSYFDKITKYKNDYILRGDELLKETIKIADITICVTKFGKRALKNIYQVDPSNIKVIYNGIKGTQNRSFAADNRKLKTDYGFSTTDRLILYAGKLEPRKGIDKLINAFSIIKDRYPDTRLILAGSGDYDAYLPLTNNFAGRIHFTGKLTSKALIDFYKFSEIGVIPSQFEQCSYVAIEMMYYGLPLIISDVPGLNELVIQGKTGMVCKTKPHNEVPNALEVDETDLVLQIESLLLEPAKAKMIAKAAYEYTINRFLSERMGKLTLKLYKNLANKILFMKGGVLT